MIVNNSVNSVISQMRSIESLAKNQLSDTVNIESVSTPKQSSFSDMMENAINNVNSNQQSAAMMSQKFEQGDETVDLAEVMVHLQKARISFEALTEVRNKLLSAYQEVMNMPV